MVDTSRTRANASGQAARVCLLAFPCSDGYFVSRTVIGYFRVEVFLGSLLFLSVALISIVYFPDRLSISRNCVGTNDNPSLTPSEISPGTGLSNVGLPLSSRTRHSREMFGCLV